eukprot:769614-Pyramimonas_sp.AAC.1
MGQADEQMKHSVLAARAACEENRRSISDLEQQRKDRGPRGWPRTTGPNFTEVPTRSEAASTASPVDAGPTERL